MILIKSDVEFLLKKSGVPKRFVNMSLGNLTMSDESLGVARNYLNSFPNIVPEGLLIIGSVGSGKTALAAGLMNDIIRAGKIFRRALWLPVPDLLDNIRKTFRQDSEEDCVSLLRDIYRAELIVLDDLGKEKPSEWVSEKLYQMVNTLYGSKGHLVVTTNFSLEELVSRFDSGNSKEQNSMGDCILSRLCEMCVVVRINSEVDRRLSRLNLVEG